jgi:hypothetical protein
MVKIITRRSRLVEQSALLPPANWLNESLGLVWPDRNHRVASYLTQIALSASVSLRYE